MLTIEIKESEIFNAEIERFITVKPTTLVLEHSLVSVSKWESKYKKPFLSLERKTELETLDYIKCMTITQNVNPDVYYCLTPEQITKINEYIDDPMTATTIKDLGPKRKSREIVTSELIYYWMIAMGIPYQYEKWHLNRLLMLIRVCNIKNAPPKNMGKRELLRNNASLNAARRKAMHTKG